MTITKKLMLFGTLSQSLVLLGLLIMHYLIESSITLRVVVIWELVATFLVTVGILYFDWTRSRYIPIYQAYTRGNTVQEKFALLTIDIFRETGILYGRMSHQELCSVINHNFEMLKLNYVYNTKEVLFLDDEHNFIHEIATIIISYR